MQRKIITLLMSIVACILLTSCNNHSTVTIFHEEQPSIAHITSELTAREQLAEMGYTDETLESLLEAGISFESVLNQSRYMTYTDRIYNNQPIGPSGEVILESYFGGILFNNDGILVVNVLEAAFAHSASAIAIAEMRELGMIIETVEFSYQDITATMDILFDVFESAREAGASSWGTIGNSIEVWLDPYTNQQREIFIGFLLEHSINPAKVNLVPAVTQQMLDWRTAYIATAVAAPRDLIVHVGEVMASLTSIAFTFENRTGEEFNYGSPWDLAYFDYALGNWVPVEPLPGAGSLAWTDEGLSLQAGATQYERINWDWRFGELPPGRYMFIRDGWLGRWDPDNDRVFAVVEFTIAVDCPAYLPPELD